MNFDVAIIGAGVSGAFCAKRISENNKNTKTIIFDLGKPPGKRRRQLEGWFGCFPTGDGKLYTNDVDKVYEICGKRKTNAINRWFMSHVNSINESKLIETKHPNAKTLKLFEAKNYNYTKLDYYQWFPESIHQLSRLIADSLVDNDNIEMSFDNEIFSILKKDKKFIISTSDGEYKAKKVILCMGRSGWRWVNNLFANFGILNEDNYAKFGITIELSGQYMKDFNKSHCVFENDEMTIGPIYWNGTLIQEDHADFTTSAFRGNENRWKSDKTFIPIIKQVYFEDEGCYQTDRVAKLAFVLSNDRVGRERVKNIFNKTSMISPIPEYNWLEKEITNLLDIFPQIINRGYVHYPTIIPMFTDINIGNNMETEVDGLFVAGESAGVSGIVSAAITGAIAGDEVCR